MLTNKDRPFLCHCAEIYSKWDSQDDCPKGRPVLHLQAASLVPPVINEKQAPVRRLGEGENSDVLSSSAFNYFFFLGHTGLVAFPWGPPPPSKKPLHVPAVVCLSEATLAMLFQQLAAMSASGVTAPGAAALMAMPSPRRSRDRQASLCLCQERPEWTTSSRQGAWEHWGSWSCGHCSFSARPPALSPARSLGLTVRGQAPVWGQEHASRSPCLHSEPKFGLSL